MKIFYIFLVCIIIQNNSFVNCARILCAFPTPSISHQTVFRAYTREMAKQGHELVIITTDPALTKDRPLDNVTEIDLGFSYQTLKESFSKVDQIQIPKRGVIVDEEFISANSFFNLYQLYMDQLKSEEVRKILDHRKKHFDLIVIEAIADNFLILTEFFEAPVIIFSSFYGKFENYEALGAMSRHPRLYPHIFRSNFEPKSIWEEIKNLYQEIRLMYVYNTLEEKQNIMLRAEYGPNTPSINELRENIDMLFVNANPIYDNNRAVPPGVVYLGALHLQPPKDIPEDLKAFVDNSKRGVIYMSLGNNVQLNKIEKELLDTFVSVLGSLPYDVLWKCDTELLQKKPENVEIRKWFPQRDLLMHSNIKLFITQGGLQSIDETIDAAVPIVCIPFLGDQWYNCHRSAELGIGMTVDPRTLTGEDFRRGITNVLQNQSYKDKVKKIRELINDQPQTPMERAVWWSEYLIRHGGARHLRAATANLSWSKYLMLDVLVTITICFIVAILLLLLFVRSFCNVKIVPNYRFTKNKDI